MRLQPLEIFSEIKNRKEVADTEANLVKKCNKPRSNGTDSLN